VLLVLLDDCASDSPCKLWHYQVFILHMGGSNLGDACYSSEQVAYRLDDATDSTQDLELPLLRQLDPYEGDGGLQGRAACRAEGACRLLGEVERHAVVCNYVQ
jgi:hypothetical protein